MRHLDGFKEHFHSSWWPQPELEKFRSQNNLTIVIRPDSSIFIEFLQALRTKDVTSVSANRFSEFSKLFILSAYICVYVVDSHRKSLDWLLTRCFRNKRYGAMAPLIYGTLKTQSLTFLNPTQNIQVSLLPFRYFAEI